MSGEARCIPCTHVVLLTREMDEVPFDLAHYPHLAFGDDPPACTGELAQRLGAVLGGPEPGGPGGPPDRLGGRAARVGLADVRTERTEIPDDEIVALMAKAKVVDLLGVFHSELFARRDFFEQVLLRHGHGELSLRMLLLDPRGGGVSPP